MINLFESNWHGTTTIAKCLLFQAKVKIPDYDEIGDQVVIEIFEIDVNHIRIVANGKEFILEAKEQ